jgi:hypothetical protein
MKTKLLLQMAIALVAMGCSENVDTISPVAESYVNEIMDVMQKNSINRNTIDWPKVRTKAIQLAGTAKTIKETYASITFALGSLNDNHSFYKAVDGTYLYNQATGCNVSSPPNAEVPANVGYVRIPGFSGFSSTAETDAFALSLQTIIKNQDSPALIGWVVDLRGNTGGNMWPMLSGVGPVLGEGLAGHFIYPDNTANAYSYQNGAAALDGTVLSSVPNFYTVIKPNPKVAVLIDGGTVSSGEAITIAFIGRANTRLFGMGPTCGKSTANAVFTLSNGALLVLTTSVMADRNKNKFGNTISPDETGFGGQSGAVKAAIDWLQK